MIHRMKNELKIAGSNFVFLTIAFAVVFTAFSLISGELLDVSCFGFEVLFPAYGAIAVGEWGKTRTDGNFDIIVSQSRSLFPWVLARYMAVYGVVSTAAVICMTIVFLIRREMPLWEMLLVYFSPALFLSSLSVLIGLKSSQEHIAALTCGMLWLMTLMFRSLLRIPGAAYIYLFIRYVGDEHGIWMINKGITGIAGFTIWGMIYWSCKKM